MRLINSLYKSEMSLCLISLVVAIFFHYFGNNLLALFTSWIAIALLVDFANKKLNKQSFFPINQLRFKKLSKIAIFGIAFCIVLEFFGSYTTRFWYYPSFSIWHYIILALPGFFAYTFILFGLYELIKSLFTRITKRNRITDRIKSLYPKIMDFELVVGIIGFIVSLTYSINFVRKSGIPFWQIYSNFNGANTVWWVIFLAAISMFFILDFFAYREHKETLTYDLLKGNITPLFSIIIANILAIVLIEFPNAPFQVWVFRNWPLQDIQFLNIPLAAYLAWPFQFLMFLPLYRIAFSEREIDIW